MNRLLLAGLSAVTLVAVMLPAHEATAVGADLFAGSRTTGQAIDAARALPFTPFYTVPAIWAPDAPGTLVRAEPAGEFELPPGVSATRILYHTRAAEGSDRLASGVVLVPYGRPPAGGWPLLAWAHGTTGVARGCAPSLMKSLFYNWQGLYEYVMLGYAVVATDYAGLGTPGRHAYLDMQSNGVDVIHSVAAAQAAVSTLSRNWIVIGHSQGGLATFGVAQLEGKLKDPNFLGTVALAGASDLEDGIAAMERASQPVLNGLMAFAAFGMKSVYPELDLKDILTDKALARYEAHVEDGCSAALGAFTEISPAEMFRPGWKENQYVKLFLARNRPAAQPIKGPLLMITGGDDPMFTEPASRKVLERLCADGARAERIVYPGLGHDPVVYGSLRDQMAWIASRFAGEPPPSSCPSH